MSEQRPPPELRSSDEVRKALATTDAEARRLVVRALSSSAAITGEAGASVLHELLGDTDWRVRKEAIGLAQALEARGVDVVPILVDALVAPAEEVALRNAAVEALSLLGAPAVEAVHEALRGRTDRPPLDADQRKLAIEVLAAARQPSSLDVVVAATSDPDANVRAAAAEAIGLIGGDAAAAALLRVLDQTEREGEAGDRFLRLVALEGLGRLGAEVPLARLQPYLQDKILRHAAVVALARSSDPAAFTLLTAALDDPSRHVAETAMRAFGALAKALPQAAPRQLPPLPKRARDRVFACVPPGTSVDTPLRKGAIAVLTRLSDLESVALLVGALSDDDVAEEADAALLALGPRALPPLVAAAREGELAVRLSAMRLLPRFVGEGAAALEREASMGVLRNALVDPTAEIVAAAASSLAQALATATTPSESDVRALLRAAARREPRVAASALGALRTLARKRPELVRPHLHEVDPQGEEAAVVCAVLAVVGGAEHVAWLSQALSAETARTRRAAVEALGLIGGDGAARAIALAITDEVSDVALAAIKALGRARGTREGSVEASGLGPLLRLLESTHESTLLAAAARALGSTQDPRAIPVLQRFVGSEVTTLACAALDALAELRAPQLAEALDVALAHSSSVVVRAALDLVDARVLEGSAERAAAAVLRTVDHASWEVRRRAIEILPRLSRAARAGGVADASRDERVPASSERATATEPESIRTLLYARAALETEPAVRDSIDRALAELGPEGAG